MMNVEMKQIGGYFELELPDAWPALFLHADGALLNSGKNALEYVLRHIDKIETIWIPSFSCETVLEPIEKLNLNYRFYHVNEQLRVQEIKLGKNDYLVYNNYFGIMDGYIRNLFAKYGEQLIVDYTQSFLSPQLPGCKAIYSPRKCFGVPDGGVAYPNLGTDEFEQDYAYGRFIHLLKRCELPASEGYQAFKENGMALRGQPIRKMSVLTQRILNSIDFHNAAEKRRENFQYLHKQFDKTNAMRGLIGDMCRESVPSFYPYMVDNADALRKRLIEQDVFVATYWPNVLSEHSAENWECGSNVEQNIVRNAIPLPIDHRYNLDDMQRIVRVLNVE